MKLYLFPEHRWRDFKLYGEMLITPVSYLGWAYVLLETLATLVWLGAINLCVALDSNVEAPFWGKEALVCFLFAHMTIASIFYEAVHQEGGVP